MSSNCAAIFSLTDVIDADAFPPVDEPEEHSQTREVQYGRTLPSDDGNWATLDDIERDHIDRTLVRTFYNQMRRLVC